MPAIKRPVNPMSPLASHRVVRDARSGLTLVELVVVMAILAGLAAIIVPLIGNRIHDSRVAATNASLHAVRAACEQYYNDMGFYPAHVPELFVSNPFGIADDAHTTAYDPIMRRGWNGPYLIHGGARHESSLQLPYRGPNPDYDGTIVDLQGMPTILDSWGTPIVLQWPTKDVYLYADANPFVRAISAGPDLSIATLDDQIWPPRYDGSGHLLDDQVCYLKGPDLRQ